MYGIYSAVGLLLLVSVQCSWQIMQENQGNDSLLTEDDLFDKPMELKNMKRHSQGTFTNDYSKYQEMKQALDLVQWLMNSKRSENSSKRHAEGTYISDVSSFQQDLFNKQFIAWLKSEKARKE